MPISILTSKGQTTIPLEVREALGLRGGMRLSFAVEGDTVVIRPQAGAMAACGMLKGPGGGEDFRKVREISQIRWAEEAAAEGLP